MLATTPVPMVANPETIDRLVVEWMTHADGPIAQRISRGAEIAKAHRVERTAEPFVFLVYSQSAPNRAYTVRRGQCNCPDGTRFPGQDKHCYAARLAVQAERLDAEAHDPTPDPDDTYYCVLCDEPIPAAEVVETAHGFMHERCAMTEPTPDPEPTCDCTCHLGLRMPCRCRRDGCAATLPPIAGGSEPADPDAPIDLELTGRSYLALVPATGLPPALGGCTRLPYTAEQARIISELYGDDPSVA